MTHSILPLDAFTWASSIESTIVSNPHPVTGRVLDGYLLTEHYQRWKEDIALLAGLGVSAVRYPIPWHRVASERDAFDWSWCDGPLEELSRAGITPIVDLVPRGTPQWLERSFADPAYPSLVAEYGAAFSERYGEICRSYVPVNDARTIAWFAGRIGWWPPYATDWTSFVSILTNLCDGACRMQRAMADLQPEARFIHIEGADLYRPFDIMDDDLVARAKERQALAHLPLDLMTGKVSDDHPLHAWLVRNGASGELLERFIALRVAPDVIGFTVTPATVVKELHRNARGEIRIHLRRSWAPIVGEIGASLSRRYDVPVMLAGSLVQGTIKRRVEWIEDSAVAVLRARAEGVPFIGYTSPPLLPPVAWSYAQQERELARSLRPLALFDLKPTPSGLERQETPVSARFRAVVQRYGEGAESAAELKEPKRPGLDHPRLLRQEPSHPSAYH